MLFWDVLSTIWIIIKKELLNHSSGLITRIWKCVLCLMAYRFLICSCCNIITVQCLWSYSCCVLANWFGLCSFPGGLSSPPSLMSCFSQKADLLFFHSRVCCGSNGLCIFFLFIPFLFVSSSVYCHCQHVKTYSSEKAFMLISMGYNVRSIWDDSSWSPRASTAVMGLCSFSCSTWINKRSCHSQSQLHCGVLLGGLAQKMKWRRMTMVPQNHGETFLSVTKGPVAHSSVILCSGAPACLSLSLHIRETRSCLMAPPLLQGSWGSGSSPLGDLCGLFKY